MSALHRTLLAIVFAMISLGVITQTPREPGVSDKEIRIGNLMPYTGPLAAVGSIGKAEAAYFDMINDRGGINGRKLRFLSFDNNSDASTALDLTRGLVERHDILLMFGSFGTPDNLAVRKYLNDNKIPQLFVASGDDEWSKPDAFPWTMGWQPSYQSEGRIYANYIQAYYPGRKVVALWQNDQFGRDLFKGLNDGLRDLIRVDIAYDIADEHLEGHVSVLKGSGAEIFVFAGVPANAAKVIRIAADLNWHPVFILGDAAASIATALRPAGRGEFRRRNLDLFPEGCERPGMEGRSGHEGLVRIHGQILSEGSQGRSRRPFWLRGRRDNGAGADAVRRRPLA